MNPYCPKGEPYPKEPSRIFLGDAREVAFPLGGIGTGNFSIGARGEFRDWEIFNSPGKGNFLPYTFFAIWAKPKGEQPTVKILESRMPPPYSGSHGFSPGEVAGLPRLDTSNLKGEYPFVWVDFKDKELPIQVSLEAFNPFIPLDADNSGIPCAIIRYEVSNYSNKVIDVSIVGSLLNAVGFDGYLDFKNIKFVGERKNEYREENGIKGLFYYSDLPPDHLKHGSMTFSIPHEKNITIKTNWLEGGWFDGIHDFWDDFCDDGILVNNPHFEAIGNELLLSKPDLKVGSIGAYCSLNPGETKIFEFLITWHFPNRKRGWNGSEECNCKVARNYYSKLFPDAWEVAKYVFEREEWLEKKSRDFHRALFTSTLPPYVIEALANNITVIRSNTCFRLEDGTFLGYEGCHDSKGCCPGSCTHVWNYAQTMAFLFPDLEQSMRKVEFGLETDDDGRMNFRTIKAFGNDVEWKKGETWGELPPSADGQLGTIIRLYRDWKISGNNALLEGLWDKAAKGLDFAITYWDTDGDFVLDGAQHVTYDIELYGPNSLTNSLFYCALKAGREMAEYMKDQKRAQRYQEVFEKGSKKMDEMLWNGEYYVQKLDNYERYRYQYGEGCLSDQLFGQFLAHVVGLGYVLPEEKVKSALKSVFKYNFRNSLANHHNLHRTFALNDEKGLLICSWPKGGRPKLPLVYCDEVWTGVEYQVAAHLIYEGFVDEGLTIVKAVRDRHDGYRRNPWNEVECGHHYVRSMASWSLLLALSGFNYDMVKGVISFCPVINQNDFSTFWSTGKAWGIYSQNRDPKSGRMNWNVEVLGGNIAGIKLNPDFSSDWGNNV